MKACFEEDGKYLHRRADAIDREERNLPRQHKKEEEEFLEQAKRKEQQAQQFQAESKQKTTVKSTDKGQNELVRSQVGDGEVIQDRSLDSVNMEQRSSRSDISDMTDSELQAQLQSLKEEMSKMNIQNMQKANVKSEKESCSNGDGTKGATGGIDNDNSKSVGKDRNPSSELEKNYYGDTDTTKKKMEYQTIDRIDATRYSDMGNVNNRMTADGRNVNTYQGTVITGLRNDQKAYATEERFNMVEIIDKEIEELDRLLTHIKEESFKYKSGHTMERSVHLQTDKIYNTDRKLQDTQLYPKAMEIEIRHDMRSTPKSMGRKTEKDRYGSYEYEDDELEKDYQYRSMASNTRRSVMPQEDTGKGEKPLHIRFVEQYDRIPMAIPRQMTDNKHGRNTDAIGEERVYQDSGRGYDEAGYRIPIDSEREERIARLQKREEMLIEQERALDEKEIALERKYTILRQQDSQRRQEYVDQEEKEILMRERRIQEKSDRMKGRNQDSNEPKRLT